MITENIDKRNILFLNKGMPEYGNNTTNVISLPG